MRLATLFNATLISVTTKRLVNELHINFWFGRVDYVTLAPILALFRVLNSGFFSRTLRPHFLVDGFAPLDLLQQYPSSGFTLARTICMRYSDTTFHIASSSKTVGRQTCRIDGGLWESRFKITAVNRSHPGREAVQKTQGACTSENPQVGLGCLFGPTRIHGCVREHHHTVHDHMITWSTCFCAKRIILLSQFGQLDSITFL